MSTDPVAAPIRDRSGATVGQLVLAQLPGRRDRLESVADRAVVEEEGTYLFSVRGFDNSESLEIVPGDELFSFDDSSRKRGRMLPRQHVGRIGVRVRGEDSTATPSFPSSRRSSKRRRNTARCWTTSPRSPPRRCYKASLQRPLHLNTTLRGGRSSCISSSRFSMRG